MPALTQIVFRDHVSEVLRGSLIPIPAEFVSAGQLAFYDKVSLGWSRCPLGYSTYAALDSLQQKIVVPGIILENDNHRRRRFPGYSNRFTKSQIEGYIRPHLQRAEDIRTERDTLYRNLTHDLRAISTEIYHEALEARDISRKYRQHTIADALDTVLSAQQMMSVRLDIVDYESGSTLPSSSDEISVFKKAEKVFLSFQRKIKAKKLTSSFIGQSYSTVAGPATLDIAIFVLIENAIKYSPAGGNISIEIIENERNISVHIGSSGPCIADGERAKIFDRGYRGKAAEDFKKESGAGVGLYAASTIVKESFKGDVYVEQGNDRRNFQGRNFYSTTFTIVLPISTKAKTAEHAVPRIRRRSLRGRGFQP